MAAVCLDGECDMSLMPMMPVMMMLLMKVAGLVLWMVRPVFRFLLLLQPAFAHPHPTWYLTDMLLIS